MRVLWESTDSSDLGSTYLGTIMHMYVRVSMFIRVCMCIEITHMYEYVYGGSSVWFGWVEFYGILTIVGYLMPNPVYTYHHHHHVMPPARISLTLSCHFSLSFIASGRSSGLHPVSSQSCCIYDQAGHPAFARSYVGVHRSTSLMSLSLLLQQCPACLVHLTWIVFMMGGRWLYSWCLVGCCLQDLFNIARSILV